MEPVLAQGLLSVSSVLLVVYTAYLRKKYGQPLALSPGTRIIPGEERIARDMGIAQDWGLAGIESLAGEVALTGPNVTRLGATSWMLAANQFTAKAAAAPELIPAFTPSGKWGYWRTDWRKMHGEKL